MKEPWHKGRGKKQSSVLSFIRPQNSQNNVVAPKAQDENAKPQPAKVALRAATPRAALTGLQNQPARSQWWSGGSAAAKTGSLSYLSRVGTPRLGASRTNSESAGAKRAMKMMSGLESTSSPAAHTASQPRPKRVRTDQLSPEQEEVLNTVLAGTSVFFTGAAGTGKSFLLGQIILGLKSKYRFDETVAITATSGLAALNIGGQTLHSWGYLGLGTESASKLAHKILGNANRKLRWQRTKVLIIDEVSMLDGNLFDKVEQVARIVRNSDVPFGGIQLVVTGDFFQLPPVDKSGKLVPLCFEAESWSKVIAKRFVLLQVFRQKGDERLISMLNALRHGNLSPELIQSFKDLDRRVEYNDGLEATQLYSRRDQVAAANKTRMDQLPGKKQVFVASDDVFSEARFKNPLDNVMALKTLELKIGAQVILIKNKTPCVNGSRGRVLTFASQAAWDVLQSLRQSNSCALDIYNSIINAEGAVTEDTKSLMDRNLSAEDAGTLLSLVSKIRGVPSPVVQFDQGVTMVMEQEEFQVTEPGNSARVLATRYQVPLIPSWALSIHKAQGQTIDRLIVDLNQVFEKGQVYVAVSRATSYDRLQVIGFSEKKVMVDARVVSFYKELEGSSQAQV